MGKIFKFRSIDTILVITMPEENKTVDSLRQELHRLAFEFEKAKYLNDKDAIESVESEISEMVVRMKRLRTQLAGKLERFQKTTKFDLT